MQIFQLGTPKNQNNEVIKYNTQKILRTNLYNILKGNIFKLTFIYYM